MFGVKKINDFKIKPVEVKKIARHWKGKEIFPNREFFNIGLFSRSGSGKTTVIFNLLKTFADKHTIFYFFSNTLEIDDTWKAIIEWVTDNNYSYFSAPTFIENKENHIEDFMKEYSKLYDDEFEPAEEEQQPPEIPAHFPNMSEKYYEGFGQPTEEEKAKEKKKKKDYERKMNFIFVFDDQSKQLQHNSIEKFLKMSRHYRTRCIISSQSLSDIRPSSHSQIYALCLFSGMSKRAVDYIFDSYELDIEKPEFYAMYKTITKPHTDGTKNYNFLTVLPFEQEYRRNFSEKILNLKQFIQP